MPELPISGLTTIGTQGGNDYFPVTEFASGITKKESRSQLLSYFNANLTSFLPLAGGTMTGEVKGSPLNFNVTGTGVTNVGNTSANLNLYGLLINVTGSQKFLTSGTGLYNSTSVASILFAASEVINVATSGNINVTSSAGYVSVIAGANNYLRFSDGLNGFGGTVTGESYLTGTSGLKVADNLAMFPMPGASSSATYVNKYILSNHYQSQDLSGGIEGIRNIIKVDNNTTASAKVYNAVQNVAGTVTDWYNFTTDGGAVSGTVTNAYHLYLGNAKLLGTNKWFLYNDDSSVHSLIKGNVTFEGKVIGSTGYASTKVLGIQGTQQSHTGDILETTKYTLSIPAGIVGANSSLRISYLATCTNNANAKTIRIRIGGTIFSNANAVSANGSIKNILISNRGAVNSQVMPLTSNIFGSGGIGVSTASVDFASTQSLTFTIENANAGDTTSLESILVEVINPAI
jgi:hypothetical protein